MVDNGGAGVNYDMFQAGALALPQKYLRNLSAMRHYISKANEIRYRGLISQRGTALGDAMLQGRDPVWAGGVPIASADMLGSNEAGVLNQGFFTYPKNLIFGIQRTIQVETDKDIRAREIIIVLTCRAALQIDEVAATVKYINI